PARSLRGAREVAPLVRVDGDGVVVEAVKLAEDRSGDLVVRLYEAHGSRTSAHLHVAAEHDGMLLTGLLEEGEELSGDREGSIELEFGPFQIRTVRIVHPNRLTSAGR